MAPLHKREAPIELSRVTVEANPGKAKASQRDEGGRLAAAAVIFDQQNPR